MLDLASMNASALGRLSRGHENHLGRVDLFASVAVAYRMWRYEQKILDEIEREFWILWPLVCAGASVICSLGVLYAKHRARKLAVT